MRIFVSTLICLGLLGLPNRTWATERPWLASVAEAFTIAEKEDRLVLVDLYADWCGYCKKLEAEVFSTPIFQELVEDFVLLRVDTEDGAEGTLLQQQYGAYKLPTILILDPSRVMVAEVQGYAPAQRYVAAIKQEIRAFEELVEGYEKFKQTNDLRALAILADEFHQRNDGARAAFLYQQMLISEELSPDRELVIRYQLTDALRLAGRYDEALPQLAKTQVVALQSGRVDLVERLDLMAARIALDRGDCQQAEAALEDFLDTHRRSSLRQQAKRTLTTIRADGYECL